MVPAQAGTRIMHTKWHTFLNFNCKGKNFLNGGRVDRYEG
jgi:hypothetical protein